MKNVGALDGAIRFGVFAVLVGAGFFSTGTTRTILWAVSLLPLLTAIFRFCPLWAAFRINTNKKS